MKILLQVELSRKHSAVENRFPTLFPAYLKVEAVVKKMEVRSRFFAFAACRWTCLRKYDDGYFTTGPLVYRPPVNTLRKSLPVSSRIGPMKSGSAKKLSFSNNAGMLCFTPLRATT